MSFDPNTLFGVLAGVVGLSDLAGLWLRGADPAARGTQLRYVGALLMFSLSAAVLAGWVRIV
ncbi:MAG: hypothetical protein KGP27_15600 [Hyphomicrobiales bacterium]|nr:hypothetical protein [Hyphomicrobiales bacterium]